MRRVLVMMSTWNGGRFLKAQLDSILSQSFDGDIHLLVRDDGSSDDTLAILDAYRGESVTVVQGHNLGAKASFMELMRLARSFDANYYALADQDDVWRPEKLSRAVDRICQVSRPAIYCSAVELVDEDLHHLSTYMHPGDRSFEAGLLSNAVTGCTAVFNRQLLEKIRFPEDVSGILMHDWWLCTIASAFGVVCYDDQSHIKYRQHGSNHVGMAVGIRGAAVRRLNSLRRPAGHASRFSHALAFQKTYEGELPAQITVTLNRFIEASESIWDRLALAVSMRAHIGGVSLIRFVLYP